MNNPTIQRKPVCPVLLPLAAAALLLPAALQATPYASQLANDAGTVSFRLNESADSVLVVYTNLSATLVTNDLGALPAGPVTNALGVPGTFSVVVSKQAGAGYASGTALQISSDANNTMRFNSPRGVAVNQNPASPYFGRIYVANSAAGSAGTRTSVGDGIYVINPDFTDAVGQGNDPRTGGITTFDSADGTDSTLSPWRLEVGQDDQLYIADYSSTNGTIYVTDPDVTTGTNILAGLGAPGSATASPNHGRIGSSVFATGSLGTGDLTLYAIDTDTTTTSDGSPNLIMRWNIGSGPVPADIAVTNVDNRTLLVNSGITMDLAKGPDGKFYTLQNRSDGFEGGIFVVDPAVDGGLFDPTPDGLWDEVYDSHADSVGVYGQTADILRQSRAVAISPDGRYMAVVRDSSDTWIIPLVDGIPNLAERKLVPTGSVNLGRDVAFDAAGNLYVATSGHAAVRVFSPGYKTIAITGSAGTFTYTNIIPDTTVTITGNITNAAEPNVNGEIAFTRTGGDTTQPLTVNFTISGTAKLGVDYSTNNLATSTNASITFPANVSYLTVPIVVIDDNIGEPTETAIFTLVGTTNYIVGDSSSTTVFIDDDGDLPSVSVASVGLGSNELLPGRPAKFKVSIPVANGVDISVNIGLSGTAVSGVDYTNPATFSVLLPAGATTTNFTVTPIDNSTIAPDKLIIASVLAGSGYTNGGGSISATNTLRNDDLPSTGAPLFSDDFDTDTSGSWTVKTSNGDSDAAFAFDYSTLGVPAAPHSTGTTKGLRLRAHLGAVSSASGVGASPTGLNLPGDYRLRFDLWMNYNGPMPGGGSGSSEYFTTGLGVDPNRTNVVLAASTTLPGSTVFFSVDGDGGFAEGTGDFIAHTNGVRIAASGTNIYPAGARDNFNAYYAEFGELPAPAEQLALYSSQTGLGQIGSLSFSWHDVVMTKQGTNYTWTVDGLRIANLGYVNATIGNNFSLGYQDVNTSLANPLDMNFALVDNLRVEPLAAPAPVITAVSLIDGGANVQIDFTGSTSDVDTAFGVQSGAVVTGVTNDVAATITTVNPGQFRAVLPTSGPIQFYRIKR